MKKFLAIVLIISTFVLIFAGCGEDGSSSLNPSSSKETYTETESSAETDNKEETSSSEINEVSSDTKTSSETSTSSEEEASSEEESSKEETSSKNKTSSKTGTSSKADTSSTASTTVEKPALNKHFIGYKYKGKVDIEDNVFIDALEYTGYNLKKHRDDGLMWKYILSSDKAHRNWLSGITYGGGSSGLETKDGLPNIEKFEKGGLVCASFATYVYFNYLPNVANVDTSSLAIPEKTYSAHSFYLACKEWLKKGYTYNIGFTATDTPWGISFKADEEIPLGSILVFRDLDKPGDTEADHISIYIGKKNGYHWVIQVGNENGPEFCAVERYKFGPDKQWPLAIFATPTCIYDAINKPNKD